MKKRVLIGIVAGLLALAVASPALGAQPPGQLGGGGSQHNNDGGQPGGGGNGPAGYEGQPGNQGG